MIIGAVWEIRAWQLQSALQIPPTACLCMRGVRAKGFYIFKESNKKAKEELHFVTFENLIIGADK